MGKELQGFIRDDDTFNRLVPGVLEACQALKDAGFTLVIVMMVVVVVSW